MTRLADRVLADLEAGKQPTYPGEAPQTGPGAAPEGEAYPAPTPLAVSPFDSGLVVTGWIDTVENGVRFERRTVVLQDPTVADMAARLQNEMDVVKVLCEPLLEGGPPSERLVQVTLRHIELRQALSEKMTNFAFRVAMRCVNDDTAQFAGHQAAERGQVLFHFVRPPAGPRPDGA